MDKAARNLVALAAIVLTVAAYGLCAFIAYGVLPLLTGHPTDDRLGLIAVTGLGTLLTLSVVLGGRALWREAAATRELSRLLGAATLATPAPLLLAAGEAGLAGRVTLLDSPECCSFVYGALVPRVAISRGLLARLSTAELRAALEHERYQVERLDPLRGALAGAGVEAMFFLPALRTLRRRYEAARELAADRRAIEICGPRPLAGALLQAIEGEASERAAAISLAAPQSIDSRLSQLENGCEPRLAGVDRRSLGASALGAFLFLTLLAGSPLAIGGGANLARELGPTSLLALGDGHFER